MKSIVKITSLSNEQLNQRLIEIDISLKRVRGYSHGACKMPNEMARANQHENTMHESGLRKEKARILTVLNERKNRNDVSEEKGEGKETHA